MPAFADADAVLLDLPLSWCRCSCCAACWVFNASCPFGRGGRSCRTVAHAGWHECCISAHITSQDMAKPIMKGQKSNATDDEIAQGKDAQHALRAILQEYLLRRTKALIADQVGCSGSHKWGTARGALAVLLSFPLVAMSDNALADVLMQMPQSCRASPSTPICFAAAQEAGQDRVVIHSVSTPSICSSLLFVSQLPKKLDKIVFCELTPLQLRAYQ